MTKINIIRNLKVAKNAQKFRNSKNTHLSNALIREDTVIEVSKYLEVIKNKYYL